MKKFILALLCFVSLANAQVVNPSFVGPGGRPSTFTNHGVLLGQSNANVVATVAGTAGQCLQSGGPSADPAWGSCAAGGAGTVTSVSVAAANGLAGSVATATTTPVITLSTSITGLLKGNGTAISAATSATDYAPATSGTSILKASSGGFANAVSGTDYAPATSGSSILAGNGSGGHTNVVVGTGLTFSGGTLTASGSAGLSVVNNYISGFTLSNDGGTPLTKLDIAAGFAADSTNASMIAGTSFVKSTAGVWASGTGNNGMGTGLTIANSTWYHVFAIVNGGSYDVYFDTSLTAANKPASTTAFRYIGSFQTNASAQIIAFTQIGQTFYWGTARTDLSGGAATTATLFTVSAPLGLNTMLIVYAQASTSDGTMWSPVLGSTFFPDNNITRTTFNTFIQVNSMYTNTSSQMYYKVNTSANLLVYTLGYINPKVAANN